MKIVSKAGLVVLLAGLMATAAYADSATTAPTTAATAAVTPPTLMPSMTGPLAANPNPFGIDTGYGKIYVGGVVSGLGLAQSHAAASDQNALADLDNGAVIINKPDGLFQFFLHVGEYSIPDLGVPYLRSGKTNDRLFGPVAEGYVKLAPTDDFSVEAGVLPTLVGNEYTYSFENANVERGLLWNQENDVNRGVQANYTVGPVAFSASLTDGFYSDQYSWLWGSATWTIDNANSLTIDGGGNLAKDDKNSFRTPVAQNNSQIYNAYLTHTSGPWTLQGEAQYTYVPQYRGGGIDDNASTYGAGLYATYKFADDSKYAGFSIPARLEFIGSTGSAASGSPNLLYGQNSKAVSFTVTPTYQYKVFFVRPEASVVKAFNKGNGDGFGSDGSANSQIRGLIETGIIF